MLFIVLVIITVIIVYIARQLWRERNCPPGPYGLPILGYLPFLDVKSPYKTLYALAHQYNGVYSIRLGNILTVVLTNTANVRDFLKREEFLGRAPLYVTHGIMGGHGLICAEGALWKDQRRHCIDSLKILGMTRKMGVAREQLEEQIYEKVLECLELFTKDSAQLTKAFDPLPALEHTLGNIINQIVFGISYSRDDKTWLYFQKLQEEGLKLVGVSGVVNFLPFLRFLPKNRNSIKFLVEGKMKTHAIYDEIIEKCRQEAMNDANSMLKCFLQECERRLASDDVTVRESAKLFYNQTQLRHFLADLFGAGMDTTLTTLRWLLLYMARNESHQIELRNQLRSTIVNGCRLIDTTISLNDLEGIDYLRACIAEVQRIRPVVPMGIPHGTERDCTIGGHFIPSGTMILPLQWAIHMDANIWLEPEKFNPKRFLDCNGQYCQPSSFMPFQSGKRICLGDELARMMLLLYTGLIFSKYSVSLAAEYADMDMTGECGITLAPLAYKVVLQEVCVVNDGPSNDADDV